MSISGPRNHLYRNGNGTNEVLAHRMLEGGAGLTVSRQNAWFARINWLREVHGKVPPHIAEFRRLLDETARRLEKA